MPGPTKKKDAYAKRHSLGITVPLDVDSDPDFMPGPYVPTPAKPKKLTKKRASAKAKASALSDDNEDFAPVKKAKKGRRAKSEPPAYASIGSNLLKEIFSKGDFGTVYSSDDGAGDEEDGSQEVCDADEEMSGSVRSLSPPEGEATTPANQANTQEDYVTESENDAALTAKSDSKQAIPPLPSNPDDSVTESESEPLPPTKRKALPASINPSPSKRQKIAAVAGKETVAPPKVAQDEDSVTEEESVTEDESVAEEESVASETEPESIYSNKALVSKLRPRPAFPLPPGQEPSGPLVLDAKLGIVVPESINNQLRPYQREGINFFYRQYADGCGGLLGDDMGLGKTIQVIAFLSAIMKKTGTSPDYHRRKRHVYQLQVDLGDNWKKTLPPANSKWPTCLIIAPSTVCPNWEREFETWGYFEVGMYTGSPKARADVLMDFKYGRLDVLITSFDIALLDIELLCDEAFSCVIVDEAHKLKKPSSKTTVACHRFPQRGRFGLTGTAIQNSYKEMWVLLDWTNPGRMGTSKQWDKYVASPLTSGQSALATEAERILKQRVANALVHDLLPKVFLRRTKDIIKDQLPNKFDNVVFCPMTEVQLEVYKKILRLDAVQNLLHTKKPCDCGSNKKRKDCCHPFEPKNMFRFIGVLINLSNHLALIIPNRKAGEEQYHQNQELASLVLPKEYRKNQDYNLLNAELCGKWKTLSALLRQWRTDPTNKVLVFTKSIMLLNMLEHHIQCKGYGHLRLDGSTKQSERMRLVDQFQSDPNIFIFLISIRAGGTGLNLVAANKVVIFDPNWNPAHDLQAMDRAFRFGQKRDVTVVRLLAAGSVEEIIYARQIYKQQQMAIGYEASVQTRYFDGVQGDASKRGELFGLENIFSLQEDKLTTKIIIEEAKIAELDWAQTQLMQKPKKNSANAELLEAEKGMKAEDGGLKGIVSFFFEDVLPPAPQQNGDQDELEKILSKTGASYSHRNDQIVAESRIAKEMGKSGKGTRRKKSATTSQNSTGKGTSKGKKSAEPAPWWPIRKHHLIEEPLEERVPKRWEALIGTKYIEDKSEIPDLVGQMRGWTHEQRQALFATLDAWQKKQWGF